MTVQRPSWAAPLSYMHMDFANGKYWNCEVPLVAGTARKGIIDGTGGASFGQLTLQRNGLYVSTLANAPRITDGYGLWAEEPRQVNTLQTRTLTNAAWTKTNCAVAKNRVGIDGLANGGHTLTPSGANWSITQAHTITSQLGVFSVFLQRTAALVGTISIALDGGATTLDVTAQLAAAPINTWVRVYREQTLANPTITVQGTSASDVIGIDQPQHEIGYFFTLISPTLPTSPLVTTTGANTRFNDEPVFNSFTIGNVNDGLRVIRNVFTYGGPWAIMMKYTGTPTATKKGWLISSDGNVIIYGGADGGPCVFQSSSTPNNGNAGFGNWNKMCGRVNGAGAQVCLNGGDISTIATGTDSKPVDPSRIFTHAGIGNNGASNNQWPVNGPVAEIALWNRDISDGMLREMSRL